MLPLTIDDLTQVGEARRVAHTWASQLGLNDHVLHRLALLTTELGRNLVLHAGHGQLLYRTLENRGVAGVELLAIDKGPGMDDVDRCLKDGYSTCGTPGTGMGAMMRQSDRFDLYSAPGRGTVLMAQLFESEPPAHSASALLALGAVNVPMHGEQECGDAWAWRDCDEGTSQIMMADGLGHGPLAAAASIQAVTVFHEQPPCATEQFVTLAHQALRRTRGAALAIAQIEFKTAVVRFTGVGNIAGVIARPGQKAVHMVSHSGTVGLEMRKVQEFEYAWPEGALLVMHSDGLGSQWSIDDYPGLFPCHPSVIAGVLFRDYSRGRDDVTVVVARAEA